MSEPIRFTVAYFSYREEPHFEWFVDALCEQAAHFLNRIQLVFVDYWLFGSHGDECARRNKMAQIVDFRCEFLHLPPKPTPWQGPYRQTKQDYFAASNARNTALIVAQNPIFVGVDDLSVPMPGWWDQVRHAATHRYVALGAYLKVRNLNVGKFIVTFDEDSKSVDSRWHTGSSEGIVPATGGHFFGCNFVVPLDLALKVNGFDEWCDGQGSEDYDFGIRIERTGVKLFFNRNMLTLESVEGHETGPSFPRIRKHVPPERLPKVLEGGYPNGLDSDHVMLRALLADSGRTRTLSDHDIYAERVLWDQKRTFSEPPCGQYDWRTGDLLSTM